MSKDTCRQKMEVAFCLIFLKLQLFHYFKQHQLKDTRIEFYSHNKSGLYGYFSLYHFSSL